MSAIPPVTATAEGPGRGRPPTGQQFELRHGDQYAVITEVGASLRVYRVADRHVITPYAAGEMAPAVHGGVLLPWPNRNRDGRYTFDGVEHHLALTEPDRHNAIHGLVLFTRWVCIEHTDSAASLTLDLIPQPGYPFPLRCEIRYELDGSGLSVTLVVSNTGERAAPFGVGFHPWLSPGGHRLDDCALQVQARGWVRADERRLPIEETATIPTDLDFRSRRRLGETVLDDGFVDAPAGRSWIRLMDPDGVEVGCWQEEGLQCWQVCTGDDLPGSRARSGLAAEPMSCTADAFRTGRRLIRLEPGDTHRVRWGLALTST